MVLEFAGGGSVYKILSSDHMKSRLTPYSRLYIVETLSAALEYLTAKTFSIAISSPRTFVSGKVGKSIRKWF